MNPYEEDKDLDWKSFNDILDKIFAYIKKIYSDDNSVENAQNINLDKSELNRKFVQDFGLNVIPNEEISFPQFAKEPSQNNEESNMIFELSNFSIDIVDGEGKIYVTMSIPDVDKEDIKLDVTNDSIEITIDTLKIKYNKVHRLPCDVKPTTAKASYINGVLDIVIKRKYKNKSKKGYRANVH